MVLERPGGLVERNFPVPDIGMDEFLLKVEMVTICGGDVIEYRGENRKAHYPLLMGHEVVGTIAAIGEKSSRRFQVQEGDRVMVEPYIRCSECDYCVKGLYQFCTRGMVYGVTVPCSLPPFLWGGYSQYMYGAPGARVHRVSDDVAAEAGCMVTVMGNGVRWVRTRGALRVGETVLVTGLGVQALASVAVAKVAGAGAVIVACREKYAERHQLARDLGADALVVLGGEGEDAERAALEEVLGLIGGGPDLAVECTGADRMMALAISALRPRGRVVAAGTRGGTPLSIDLDGIVFKEVDILGGLGQAGDTELAADLVNAGTLPIARMVSHVFPLGEAVKAVELMMEGREEVVHIGLDPWS
jgi:threonine dehydrogenase-like Zn-dependent dehydrogenase